MKNLLLFLMFLYIAFPGCTARKGIITEPVKVEHIEEIDTEGCWLDREADTIHRITGARGEEKVVSIIKYRENKPLEVMKIVSCENITGSMRWIYFVPSTKYIVEFEVKSVDGSGMNVQWKNRSADGKTETGSDLLVRCDE